MLTNQFPGVHVKEIPSGARPIASISTSNTVFVDVFKKGPVDKAVRLTSYADFERIFGGLWGPSEASYAVQQYFQNGGGVAFVIRTIWRWTSESARPATSKPAAKATHMAQTEASADALKVTALTEGSWGNAIRYAVVAQDASTFDLLVREYRGNTIITEEVYQGLHRITARPNSADTMINGVSRLITVAGQGNRLPKATNLDALDPAPTLDDVKEFPKASFVPLVDGEDDFLPGDPSFEGPAVDALTGSQSLRTGIYALENIVPDIFNIMCIPTAANLSVVNAKLVYQAAEKFCRDRYAFLIVDPKDGTGHDKIYNDWFSDLGSAVSRNAAGFYPRLNIVDTENGGALRSQSPSGMIAGMMARIDSSRGIWKSTAGTETRFAGGEPEYLLTDLEQEPLNRLGVNALRSFPVYGNIIWGARTLVGADDLADEYKYIAVRRTALFIQQSLQRGLKWTVFEGNDETLWGQVRLNVGTFMQGLHRQGAFQGAKASEAYLVKCDDETTTQGDIDLGIVNILVAFAPLKPAEFVVLNFKQLTKLPE